MKSVILIVCSVFLFSCNNQIRFNQEKWKIRVDGEYPYRDKMLKDLLANYPLTGRRYNDVIKILGQQDFHNDSSIGYEIITDYGWNIDPVYTKKLNFFLSHDSIIITFKIDEWKH